MYISASPKQNTRITGNRDPSSGNTDE